MELYFGVFFAEALNKPIQRFQGAMSMMSKLNFPREALILASIYDQLFSLFLKLLALIPLLWVLGYPPTFDWIFAFIGIFGLLMTGISLGLLLSPLGLLYNDIGKGLPLILPFAMYLSPVIYPLREGGKLALLQDYNPVTPFLEFTRSNLGGYDFTLIGPMYIWSGIVFIVFVFFFIGCKGSHAHDYRKERFIIWKMKY
ncbi:ABC transporter permease [Algoriphagus boritolerans]|uniref:ABC transporter permease n=1 Tax=Algoriphagus boritolerans TaxID=308111 RepID=UPI000B1D2E97